MTLYRFNAFEPVVVILRRIVKENCGRWSVDYWSVSSARGNRSAGTSQGEIGNNFGRMPQLGITALFFLNKEACTVSIDIGDSNRSRIRSISRSKRCKKGNIVNALAKINRRHLVTDCSTRLTSNQLPPGKFSLAGFNRDIAHDFFTMARSSKALLLLQEQLETICGYIVLPNDHSRGVVIGLNGRKDDGRCIKILIKLKCLSRSIGRHLPNFDPLSA